MLTFEQVQHAWQVQDPTLIDKLCTLVSQNDPVIHEPIPEDELTFEKFLSKIFSYSFREQPDEVQFAERLRMIAKLEADEGVYPLPPRYKIHLILTALWEDGSDYSRELLKQAINKLPLSYGVWKGLKRIYKSAEYQQDYEIFGLITAKVDLYRFDKTARTPVSLPTKTYMSLRAWRYLRTLGQQMPTAYIEAVVQVLASYESDMTVNSAKRAQSWVLNHICFHNSVGYGVNRFESHNKRKLFDAKGRAFSEVWQRDYQPLIKLLATAKNEAIRQFATDSLKHDFKTALRDVDVETIQYLSAGFEHSLAKDEMIVWLLEQSPDFEKAKFVELGLHDVVLKLLYSDFANAYDYAISYAKSYASNINVDELLLLALSPHENVRKFAIEQILARDPIKDIGLAGWGQLLDNEYLHETASQQIAKHFSKKQLTPAWFFERLTSGSIYSADFAIKQLPSLYSAKELGSDYLISLISHLDVPQSSSSQSNLSQANAPQYSHRQNHLNQQVSELALQELKRLDLSQIEADTWQYLLLHPFSQDTIISWIEEEIIGISKLPMSYWHALAYEPDWKQSKYIKQLTQNYPQDNYSENNSPKIWQQNLTFNEHLADIVRSWLSDIRRVSPPDLGFDWLMTLAQSEHASYRDFAISRINKGFLPADFAKFNDESSDSESQASTESEKSGDAGEPQASDIDLSEAHVDLEKQRFLFTGKMQSMTRGEAEKLVKEANGEINGAVNGKLDYLVIGDEGSALYGNGRKGSKQVKAESLIEKGATLKIISETAFLQMLTGQVREVSEDATLAGSETLWHMATDDPNAPISELALSYLTHHHAQICMALTDRPVDPEAVIPNEFFDAERIIPVLSHTNTRLRNFALLVAGYELANWQPTPALWVQMAESPYTEVTDLLKRALLDKPSAENRRYHVSEDQYNEAMLQAFIASRQRFARQIGITLLQRHPKFQDVETLYRLTQSTQREVRYASVSMLWQHYKASHVSKGWSPYTELNPSNSANPNVDAKANADIKANDVDSNDSSYDVNNAQPQQLLTEVPADFEQLLGLLRQGLFEVPPGRLPGSKDGNNVTSVNSKKHDEKDKQKHAKQTDNTNNDATLQPISASRAKLALIETFRDVALADKDFAKVVMPILYTFTYSTGKMERNECLVAVTRLLNRYPDLADYLQPATA